MSGIKEKEAMAKRIEAESNMEKGIDNPAGEFTDLMDSTDNGNDSTNGSGSHTNGSSGDDDEIDCVEKKKKEVEAGEYEDDDEPVDMTPKVDVYYVVMAALIGLILLGVLFYFAVTTFGKEKPPEVIWRNITIIEKAPVVRNATELWELVTNETWATTEGTTEFDYYLN